MSVNRDVYIITNIIPFSIHRKKGNVAAMDVDFGARSTFGKVNIKQNVDKYRFR